ncbi:TlpA disulfide reductase family protein [Marivirga harenae]|uniref:TlpA disulfide reductase family protein n=1 Tax=Marivirga harenae TaxID=2010992 RepID=UPI0026E0AFAC|nr:TlpA disulfide reductase family protein [Marivirga harenae]WKV12749.1 TlpA disulfide reductase family protein [Marivirga harenae]|tara:strand:- start:8333 stop:9550 length:1218 start_codon:yes stop_codon:yes gene_type:complete
MKYLSLLASVLLLACSPQQEKIELSGGWIGEISMQGKTMPFEMKIQEEQEGDITATIINGEEKIILDEIARNNDSLHIPLHIFDITLDLKIGNNVLAGSYTKHYETDYVLPITFHKGENRFIRNSQKKPADFSGKWEVTFIEPKEQDTTEAVGIFEQNGQDIKGTFLTPLGDYRYLVGFADGNQMKLSTFDGNHAFLFEAQLENDNTLTGDFYSGKDWYESWTAFRNDDAELPNPDSLTYLKKGYDNIYFSFPNLEKEKVSINDEKYQDKVVIVQIFGTWCPNCMDETKFLTKWYDENKDRGVEIIGLAYEAKDDFEYAKSRVEKMINKYEVKYDFLIAGTNDKEEASKTLPMLNQVISFPTMIILNKDGELVNIHTGFNGPGTGKYYDDFVANFNAKMDSLLHQ